MRVGIVGTSGTIERSFEKNTSELYGTCGNNTGNLVFWYAFNGHIDATERYFSSFHFDPDEMNKCDVMVFIFANHVNPGMDLGFLVEKLEKVRIPIVAIGLGAQSGLNEEIDSLPQGSITFFKSLSQRVDQIGVRGEFTKKTLAKFGIDNTVVLGCISNFLSDKAASVIPDSYDSLMGARRIGVNSDFISSVTPFNRMLARIYPAAVFDFIAQAPQELIHFSRNEAHLVSESYTKFSSGILSAFARNPNDQKEISQLRDRIYSFFDTNAWIEYSRRLDLSAGSRMHGNMAAFQGGATTVFVPHDSRTKELAQTMQLPMFELAKCDQIDSREKFVQNIDFDKERYLQRRSELKPRYVSMLDSVGLKVSDRLQRI